MTSRDSSTQEHSSQASLDRPKPARILLGGGIGSGKSSVGALFEKAGFLVIDPDRIGRELLSPGTPERAAVTDIWPDAVKSGVLDRAALAGIVFDDALQLRRLESITHPAIVVEIEQRVASTEKDVVVEVPLMHLQLAGEWMKVAVVADAETRIARVVARGSDAKDVAARMKSQSSTPEWISWADIVVENGGAWVATEHLVAAIIDRLRG